jgi:hypothetical protein
LAVDESFVNSSSKHDKSTAATYTVVAGGNAS